MKTTKWNEDKLQLSKQKYVVPHYNTISLAESQRLIILCGDLHRRPLLPEEWVIVRLN